MTRTTPLARAALQTQWMRDVMRLEPTVTINRTGKSVQRLLELHTRFIASNTQR